MRIVYITDEHLSSSAAETVHINTVCAELTALGNTVTLYAPQSADFGIPKNYSLEYVAVPTIGKAVFYQLKLFLSLSKKFAANKPDIIYSRHNQLLFVPAMLSRKFNIPLVLESNGRLVEETAQRALSLADKILVGFGILKIIEAFNIKTAAKVIAVAPGIKDYIVKEYNPPVDKVVVIANGVDTALFKPANKNSARLALGLDPNKICVGYVGSFYAWQGLKYILEAAKTVVTNNPNVEFLIVGGGDEKVMLENFVAANNLNEQIKILPGVAHTQVPVYLNAFDIGLCYPIKFRAGATAPFKLYEYLACGIAVATSDIGGIKEEFGDNMLFADAENSPDLAKKIILLVEDKALRDNLGARGLAFIQAGKTWSAVTKKISEILKNAI